MKRSTLAAGFGFMSVIGVAALAVRSMADTPPSRPGEVAVTLDGGYDTDRKDGGRPVILVASALGVPADVFRDAFAHVRPAKTGGPTPDEARQNKHELLSRLEKYGVTNERLDEVSNYYRYRPQNGELWRHKRAVVFATVKDGVVTGFRIADPGAGYSSSPTASVAGTPNLKASVLLKFDKDMQKNGSVDSMKMASPTTTP